MAIKNPPLLCLGAFTLSLLLKHKWGRWISFLLFLELCWGFVAPEDVKQGGGDVPMTLWQICCTRAVAPPALLKVTLLHIWNWVSCLPFCEVKSGLNILIFHQNTSCLLPDRGVSICKALHLRDVIYIFVSMLVFISKPGLWWEGKHQHLWYEWGQLSLGVSRSQFCTSEAAEIVQFCFFLNYLRDLQPKLVL